MDATSRAKEDIARLLVRAWRKRYVTLLTSLEVQEVKARVRHDIGAIASLAAAEVDTAVRVGSAHVAQWICCMHLSEVVEQLPKTRSGKALAVLRSPQFAVLRRLESRSNLLQRLGRCCEKTSVAWPMGSCHLYPAPSSALAARLRQLFFALRCLGSEPRSCRR